MNAIRYHLSRDWLTQLYTATLLGGELANCYGQGRTEAEAVTLLKLQRRAMLNERQRRKEKNGPDTSPD